jgi:hypothetical protein
MVRANILWCRFAVPGEPGAPLALPQATPAATGDQPVKAPDRTPRIATPEIIFTGGRVHTVNASNDIVEAVAVGGGRILAGRISCDPCPRP